MSGVIASGGITYDTVQLRCRVSQSYRPDEFLVSIDAEDAVEPAAYLVDRDLVVVDREPASRETVEGRVTVLLLDRQNGTVIVEVPGEPMSYGPKITVPKLSVLDA